MLIAHRGIWNKDVKDNSYEAIYNGLYSPSYIGIECDIRWTKDKKFIVYHNILYKGNLVKNTYYKDMKDISLLEDILKIETNKLLVLEIKDCNIDKKKLLRILSKYKRNYYIMSFNTKVIKELRRINSNYKYGILNYLFNSEYDYNLDFICLLDSFTTSKIVDYFLKRNIDVIIYGSNKINKNVKYIVDDVKVKK